MSDAIRAKDEEIARLRDLARRLAKAMDQEWVKASSETCWAPHREPLRKALAEAREAGLLEKP